MIVNALTSFHVALSLIGIGSGVVAIYGLLKAKRPGRWMQVFLATTAATSITNFLFPFHGVTPAQVLGVLSLIALIIGSLPIYRYHSKGTWRRTYGITAVMALYFNVLVLAVHFFRRVPALSVMAPTQSEPPFQVAQLAVLLLFAAGAKPQQGLVP
jgi:branched-subunit amino acid transport protein AzlD